MTRPSTPPAASTILVLSSDILATRAGELLDQLACGSWAPAQKLREALQCYSEVRLGSAVKDASDDPQTLNDPGPAPITQRSAHHG